MFFVTNGTSTSNKMVHQALLEPGDIVIADRNCHKSHHYGMVLAGAQPYYVEAFPMVAYSMYGAVPASIKKALLDLKAAGRLDKVKTVTLTNCTFDGHVYDVRRVMEECLAIKPDLIFLWDEAWFGFARFSPLYRPRTAMGARADLKEAFADPGTWSASRRRSSSARTSTPRTRACSTRGSSPIRARPSCASTRRTRRTSRCPRCGRARWCWWPTRTTTGTSRPSRRLFTHASTSPNQQIIASLDVAPADGAGRLRAW